MDVGLKPLLLLTSSSLAGCLALLYQQSGAWLASVALALVAATGVFAAFGGVMYVKSVIRDAKGLRLLLSIKRNMREIAREGKTVSQRFELQASTFPEKPMFIFEGKRISFKEVDQRSSEVASMLQNLGVSRGDCVALFLDNSPDLVIFWLGAAKIGAVSALINFNLREKPLVHCLTICHPKAIIVSDTLASALESQDELPENCTVLIHKEGFLSGKCEVGLNNSEWVQDKLEEGSSYHNDSPLDLQDNLLYIYTSGTTGLPKAAKISNYRFFYMSSSMATHNKFTQSDIIWTPLPLYHSNAGILGVGMAIYCGATLAFRRKFSASRFWQDIVHSEATVFQYLGEICRYVYKQPVSDLETKHKLRLIMGNGLNKSFWTAFVKRYRIPKVCEIYGSTEGNCNMVSIDDTPGAVGFVSIVFGRRTHNVNILKCDDEGNLIRGKDGLCIEAQPGEQGHIVGRIKPGDPTKDFEGYLGEKETQKKVARDVLKRGDMVFLSGDILFIDRMGYLYFKDRTGDTFRWKGENVATCEVEGVIQPAVQHRDVIVYGVHVPGNDGRAGMAAILNDDKAVDMGAVSRAVLALPSYARPVFVRLLPNTSQHLTGTFKLRKIDLQRQGFDPAVIQDDLWLWSPLNTKYEPLTQNMYNKIINMQINL